MTEENELAKARAEAIEATVERIVMNFQDGFQFSDVLAAARAAMEVADEMSSLSGPEKKSFVCEAVKVAYNRVNPNIPWVPEPIETWVENYVFNNLVPYFIDHLVDATKGKVEVNK